jgi:hypothetical protein
MTFLVVLISFLPGFYPLQHTSAQTNGLIEILVKDAIEDLQNNNTNTALTHSNLASQKLSSQGVSSSDSSLVLINDAIQDLLNNDTRNESKRNYTAIWTYDVQSWHKRLL